MNFRFKWRINPRNRHFSRLILLADPLLDHLKTHVISAILNIHQVHFFLSHFFYQSDNTVSTNINFIDLYVARRKYLNGILIFLCFLMLQFLILCLFIVEVFTIFEKVLKILLLFQRLELTIRLKCWFCLFWPFGAE